MLINPLVLAGGSGNRLWPISRELYPKQFLALTSEYSLFQETLRRCRHLESASAPTIICHHDYRFIAAEQAHELNELSVAQIILEPASKNTAPAIALGCLAAPVDSLVLVLPADHYVADLQRFAAAVTAGVPRALAGDLVIFGIPPQNAHTGYGYIKTATELAPGVQRVASFTEKPDLSTATQYLQEGGYFWNSGMFLFRPEVYLQELQTQEPQIYNACRKAWEGAYGDLDFRRVEEESFQRSPAQSIDYAILERVPQKVAMVELAAGWSDIGSWKALWEMHDKDHKGNVQRGKVQLHEVRNSYVYSEDRLVAALGVEDLVIVDTRDATLVLPKEQEQRVKELVEQLKQQNHPEARFHHRVHSPWGNTEALDAGDRFRVKRLILQPGKETSRRLHHHKAQHWIVVQGTAEVEMAEQIQILSENQSIYIPIGTPHCLKNPGKIPLQVIEVQTGGYLEEDDIVRL